jgi:hypothetical protein
MLIQYVVCAVCAPLIRNAFGFGSAEPVSIGLCLLLQLMPFSALLEPLQVN